MSYDIYLTIDTGGEETSTVVDVGNYTSNVSGMWTKALGFPLGDLHGRLAADCIEPLERAVSHITNPQYLAEYRAMEPDNGWGSHQGAGRYLQELLNQCQNHPKCTVEISR